MNIYERLIEILVEEKIDPKVRKRRKDALERAKHRRYQELYGTMEEPYEPGDRTPDPDLMKPEKDRS